MFVYQSADSCTKPDQKMRDRFPILPDDDLESRHVVLEEDAGNAVRVGPVVDLTTLLLHRVLVSRVDAAQGLDVGGDDLNEVLVVHEVWNKQDLIKVIFFERWIKINKMPNATILELLDLFGN